MRTAITTLTASLLLLLTVEQAAGCAYGIFDADVETACSGDPLQAKIALARIKKDGPGKLPAIEFYRQTALRQQRSYTRYLERLESHDPQLQIDETQRATEIIRAKAFLEFNVRRLRTLDLLIYELGGRDFAGEPWRCFTPTVA